MTFKSPSWPLLLMSGITFAFQPVAPGQHIIGLQPGVKAPEIALADQTGKPQTLSTLTGPNGLLLLFFRSADWCPFCKGQLVDLERAQKLFATKGINVAGVSYDYPEVLAEFSQRKSITYPLLSDSSSKLIDAFGVRNVEATGAQAGIPVPGYYLINKQGVIEKQFFEDGYINRLTANNVYQNIFGRDRFMLLSAHPQDDLWLTRTLCRCGGKQLCARPRNTLAWVFFQARRAGSFSNQSRE